jgi:hypothetical protein
MRVLEYLTTVSGIVETYNHLYPSEDNPLTEAYYLAHYIPMFKNRVLLNSDLVVVIDHYEYRYDDPVDNTSEYRVQAQYDGEIFSMSFIPWGETLNAHVVDNTNSTDAEVAAHLFWEITFHGDEIDMEEARDSLLDQVEQLDRGNLKTYTLEEVEEMLFKDETISQREDRMARQERYRRNLKTMQVYRNGELFDGF